MHAPAAPSPARAHPAPVNPTHRARARGLRILAAGAAAASLLACGGPSGPPPAGPDPESIPLRTVFVATREGGDPRAKEIRTRAEALARAQEVKRRLLTAGTTFGTVAKEMSEDRLTTVDEGFAGFVAPWTKEVPEILKAASALTIGGISDPVETAAGFHVLQRLSRAEGKAEESKHAAAVVGFLVQWHDLVQSLPSTQTKEQAYAEAAKAATELKAGTLTNAEAQGRILGALPFDAGLRLKSAVGFEPVAAAALALETEKWSDPIETPNGWAVVQRRPYLRAYVRHLVVTHRFSSAPAVQNPRSPQEARERAQEALAKILKDPSSWDRVVAEYSEEPGSKDKHGFIGEAVSTDPIGRRMATEFLDAIAAIPPGEIGKEIVATRYGYHVLWRVD